MAEARVKATPVNGAVKFIQQELTPEQLRTVRELFTPQELKYLSGSVLASEEVPLELLNRFTRMAAEAKGQSVESFGRGAGRFGADLGMKTVYKFLMLVLSMETIFKKAQTIFSRVYNMGQFNVEVSGKTAVAHLREFPSEEVGCARLSGWLEYLGTAVGVDNMKVRHVECIAKGAKECRWEMSWE